MFLSRPSSPRASLEKKDILLLVFVNVKSGGKQGLALLPKLRTLLPPEQVVDIINEGGPESALAKFKQNSSNLYILACGGDGTGKWILEAMDKMGFQQNPPVGILPLGTGNDIARGLGWGGGYTGDGMFMRKDSLIPILQKIYAATPVLLDRWQVVMTPADSSKPAETHVLNNYLTLGFADSQVALEFHNTREKNPGLFTQRGINKLWYASYTLKTTVVETFTEINHLADVLSLEVDGRGIDLPSDLQGIVVLNLTTYSGGISLWGTPNDERWRVPSINDGHIEVIGIINAFHLARMALDNQGKGNTYGVRLAQGSRIRITYKEGSPPMPCKIDGEPWLQHEPVEFTINLFKQSVMLARTSCPTSIVNPEKEGWVSTSKMRMTWVRRWLMLKDCFLYYYETTQDPHPRKVLGLTGANVRVATGKEERWRDNCLIIEVPLEGGRLHYISCDTAEDMSHWIGCLQNATKLSPRNSFALMNRNYDDEDEEDRKEKEKESEGLLSPLDALNKRLWKPARSASFSGQRSTSPKDWFFRSS
ncbi:Diacylglycerol kinase [Balamuthia mandrillaris]